MSTLWHQYGLRRNPFFQEPLADDGDGPELKEFFTGRAADMAPEEGVGRLEISKCSAGSGLIHRHGSFDQRTGNFLFDNDFQPSPTLAR